jgi:hypothetical protein
VPPPFWRSGKRISKANKLAEFFSRENAKTQKKISLAKAVGSSPVSGEAGRCNKMCLHLFHLFSRKKAKNIFLQKAVGSSPVSGEAGRGKTMFAFIPFIGLRFG